MNESEHAEYLDLINKWNSTDITPEQEKRLEELDVIALDDAQLREGRKA